MIGLEPHGQGLLELSAETSGERVLVHPKVRMVTNNFPSMHRAVCRGLGFASIPTLFVTDELRSGELVAVLPGWHAERKFGTTSTKSVIDARPFIDLVLEQGYADSSWFISTMGWEITGANKDAYDANLGASAGKMVFGCYSVPSLNGTGGTGPGFAQCS